MTPEGDCFEIAHAGNPAHLREFNLPIDGKTFVVKVGTPGYVEELRARNAVRPDDAKIDEKIFTFPDVASAEQLGLMDEQEVCRRLHQIPLAELSPFLVEQTMDQV